MREGWEIKKLEDACDKQSSNVSQNQLEKEQGEYPIYGATGLIKNVSFYHQDKPYLSIVKDGSGVGRVTKMDAYTSVIGTLQYLLPKEGIDLYYLHYSLMSVNFKKYVAGAAIPHIYYKDYKNEPFLWMPLPEQKRIVEILDETFAAIDKAKANVEKNLQNAKDLFASYKFQIFTSMESNNDKVPLSSVCDEIFAGGDAPRENFSTIKTEKYKIPILANAVEKDGLYGYTDLVRVNRPSITIAARGSGTGHTEIRTEPFFPIVRLIVLIPKIDVVNFKFLKHSIQNLKILKSGSAIPQLTVPMIKVYSLPLPNLIHQKNIVEKLDILSTETKKLETIYQQKLNDFEELKKSILQKAFNGELTRKELAI